MIPAFQLARLRIEQGAFCKEELFRSPLTLKQVSICGYAASQISVQVTLKLIRNSVTMATRRGDR